MLTKPTETANRSFLVANFESVSIAAGLACPHCAKAFGPHDLHHDGSGEFQLRCTNCQRDAITATLLAPIDEEGE